ncbi:MAG: type II toxin-antitoxin system HigB family toxin [Oligoflexales bacterium]|nr:type II toxin-antitoxin system HigB family toxin [Oligoflexales bacterium]
MTDYLPGKTNPCDGIILKTVFDIDDNFRLIVLIDYKEQMAVVEYVLTHREYDKDKWRRK